LRCRTDGETWDNADVSRTRSRRVVAAICIAAIFLAAIVPVAAGLFSAVLVPLPALFGTIVSVDAPAPECVSPEPFPPRSPLPGRAPPA
jgi:hypothetical protein